MKITDIDRHRITGTFVILEPYTDKYINEILQLRNKDEVRYNLNQTFLLTNEQQEEWSKAYFERENDLYWVILDRESQAFLGTTALYDMVNQQGEKGRFIIDDSKVLAKPYALESEVLLLNYAFNVCHLNKVITCTREDNFNMTSINKKLGFVFSHSVLIRDVTYHYYQLEKQAYTPEKFTKLLAHWEKRK